jgi:hypothetical protein
VLLGRHSSSELLLTHFKEFALRGNMKSAVVLLGVVLLLSFPTYAQEHFLATQNLPDAASAQTFWTVQTKVDFAIFSAELAADAITTQQGLNRGMREMNPLARPFVTRGAAGQAAGSAISMGAAIGMAYLLHRTHHYKAERIAVRLLVLGEGAVVARNFAVLR